MTCFLFWRQTDRSDVSPFAYYLALSYCWVIDLPWVDRIFEDPADRRGGYTPFTRIDHQIVRSGLPSSFVDSLPRYSHRWCLSTPTSLSWVYPSASEVRRLPHAETALTSR